MKKQLLLNLWLRSLSLPILALFLLISSKGYGSQNSAPPADKKVFKDWTLLEENSSKLIDVFYRIVECDTSNYIEIRIFNENSQDQKVVFDINVKNGMTGANFDKSISMTVNKGAIIESPCTANKSDNLAIELPKSYNPEKIILVKLTFK